MKFYVKCWRKWTFLILRVNLVIFFYWKLDIWDLQFPNKNEIIYYTITNFNKHYLKGHKINFIFFPQVTNFSNREKLPTTWSFGFELCQIMRDQVFTAEKSFTTWTKCCFWAEIVLGMSKWIAKVKCLTIFPFC